MKQAEAKQVIAKLNQNMLQFLDENRERPVLQYISTHEDELKEVTRGYGNAAKPEDYLQSFGQFIPEFLKSCLNSPRTKERMLGMMSGNAIRRLTLTKIKKGLIPLPSIGEQKVLIKTLKKINELDQKIKLCTDNKIIIDSLKQSILSKAFHGKLGTNDPTEESAMELLKQVLQEKLQ